MISFFISEPNKNKQVIPSDKYTIAQIVFVIKAEQPKRAVVLSLSEE